MNARETGKISWQLGIAMVAGVPALVFVSIGQIASLAGNAAVVVWIVSSVIGLAMAFTFAHLARCFPAVPGGIGILSGYAHSDSPFTAGLSRWSYWLGWSPGLAIFSAVFGNYVASLIGQRDRPLTALLISLAAIVVCTALNYRGLSSGAIVQTLLGLVMLPLLIFFGGAPLVSGQFSMGRLLPMTPPNGWTSWTGVAAVAGALFLAGWTCYGAELAISLASEYRRGTKDTVACLAIVAAITFGVYVTVPVLITGAIGVDRVREDPAAAMLALVPGSMASIGKVLVFAAIFVSLFLSINMIAVTSSRLLYQIARDEPPFRFLGDLNRHGVPGKALLFDMGGNIALIVLTFAISGGRSADVPLALLCAANVGYFVTIILALTGASAAADRAGGVRPLCCSRPVVALMAAINLLLLACAGFAWGWRNVGLGWAVLAGLMIVTTALRKWRPAARTSPSEVVAA